MAREGPDDAAELDRAVGGRPRAVSAAEPATGADRDIEVFTTRIDTIYGATFVLLAPEHPIVEQFAPRVAGSGRVPRAGDRFRARTARRAMTGEVEKEGFDTGRRAINPFTGEPVPIWVANFVLGEYGTGAVMAVPAHDQRDFEFARKYGLPSGSWFSPTAAALGRRDRSTEAVRGPRHARRVRRVQRPDGRRGASPR